MLSPEPHGEVTRGDVAMTLVDLMVRDRALITLPSASPR